MLQRFDSFVTGITLCYKSIQRIKSMETTELGLKGTHVMCLFYLHHNQEGMTAAQLAVRCEEDKGAVSRTLAELTELGYVLPVESDGKKKYRALIQLSDAGNQVAEKVDTLISGWVSAVGEGLSEAERESFYYALGVISENLKHKTSDRAKG